MPSAAELKKTEFYAAGAKLQSNAGHHRTERFVVYQKRFMTRSLLRIYSWQAAVRILIASKEADGSVTTYLVPYAAVAQYICSQVFQNMILRQGVAISKGITTRPILRR